MSGLIVSQGRSNRSQGEAWTYTKAWRASHLLRGGDGRHEDVGVNSFLLPDLIDANQDERAVAREDEVGIVDLVGARQERVDGVAREEAARRVAVFFGGWGVW